MPLRSASAVIVYNPTTPATPVRNLSAPTGSLLNSGWQYQGNWGNASGTPISPQHFITAGHLNTQSGSFTLGNTTYTIDTSYGTSGFKDDPASDLRVWKITGTFPAAGIAPLYNAASDGSELNKGLVAFGRGYTAGAAVSVGGELKGWQWGSFDGQRSWGQNNVAGILTGGATVGQVLSFSFDRSVGTQPGSNESSLTAFDSGGGLFIKSGGVWKLAGVHFTIDGRYKTSLTGTPFNATLFDKGGVYEEVATDVFALNLESAADLPGNSYSTRISSNMTFIQSAIPEPSAAALIAVGSLALGLRRRRPASRASSY